MVNKKQTTVYIIENDHKLAEYCSREKIMPNSISTDKFIKIAEEIGWVMSTDEYEMYHNTRALPKFYFIRIINE